MAYARVEIPEKVHRDNQIDDGKKQRGGHQKDTERAENGTESGLYQVANYGCEDIDGQYNQAGRAYRIEKHVDKRRQFSCRLRVYPLVCFQVIKQETAPLARSVRKVS